MRRFPVWLAACACAISFVACDKHTATTPAVTPLPFEPSPTAVSVGLSLGPDTVSVGRAEVLVLTARLADGSSRVVDATWTSDAPSVATVATDGAVSGRSPGQASITGLYQGLSASRGFRVLPVLTGPWAGAYKTQSCTATGDWTRGCASVSLTTRWTLTVTFDQTGSSASATIGAVRNLPVTATGSIALDGHFTTSGSAGYVIDNVPYVMTLSDWDTVTVNNATMTGRFTLTYSSPRFKGSLIESEVLDGFGRVSRASSTSTTTATAAHISSVAERP